MIYHHNEDVNLNLKNKLLIRKWIKECIINEQKKMGDINLIYCSDEYLLKLNISALQHDYYTDIITFDYTEAEVISGDLFISIDRVEDNAKKFNINFQRELYRVMIHGVLHLCGYKDKSTSDEKLMQSKEDHYLMKLSDSISI